MLGTLLSRAGFMFLKFLLSGARMVESIRNALCLYFMLFLKLDIARFSIINHISRFRAFYHITSNKTEIYNTIIPKIHPILRQTNNGYVDKFY